jgi:hypothetical protein
MKSIAYLINILAVVFIFTRCEEDVKAPLADRPYPVVYCLLDKDDTAHYVRLTKTFSGPVPATVMAQNPDSLYYKNARVFAEMPGKTVEMMPVSEVQRDSGLFFSEYSLLYKTTYRLCGSVRIHVFLPDFGMEVLGSTFLMGTRVFTEPNPKNKKVLGFYETEPVRIIWNGVEGVCETTIRFKYLEINDSGVDTCHVDWIRKNSDFAIMPVELLEYLNNWIPDKPEIRYRKVLGIDILVASGNGQLADYMRLKDWSIDIAERPYSNLTNAYGLIASRAKGALTDYMPNQRFIDTLVNGEVTRHLRFVRW